MQRAMSSYTVADTSLNMIATKDKRLEIYSDNVEKRLKDYKDKFSWSFEGEWVVDSFEPTKMVVEREGTIDMHIDLIAQIGLGAIMKKGSYPESSAKSVNSCNACPALMKLELVSENDEWKIDSVEVVRRQ
mmetsp:Transcript_34796/g.74236  ORF Transcript_34796/g.74236 Transcript_34796/m.74236 type:complete len:131 (-) Transcript_34796:96-488(-)